MSFSLLTWIKQSFYRKSILYLLEPNLTEKSKELYQIGLLLSRFELRKQMKFHWCFSQGFERKHITFLILFHGLVEI